MKIVDFRSRNSSKFSLIQPNSGKFSQLRKFFLIWELTKNFKNNRGLPFTDPQSNPVAVSQTRAWLSRDG
jgi:hypothetical protein